MLTGTHNWVSKALAIIAPLGPIHRITANTGPAIDLIANLTVDGGGLSIERVDNKWIVEHTIGVQVYRAVTHSLSYSLFIVFGLRHAPILSVVHKLNPVLVYQSIMDGELAQHNLDRPVDLTAFWNLLTTDQQSMLGLYLLSLNGIQSSIRSSLNETNPITGPKTECPTDE